MTAATPVLPGSAGPSLGTAAPARRPAPRGINPAYVRLELRRLVRNRRTVIFSMIMPAVFFLIFGASPAYSGQSYGHGNVAAYVLVSMALYGALLTTTAGGASVSVERAQGWTRQIRLTPLRPWAYVATKLTAAMALGAASILFTLVVGLFAKASMPATSWVFCALIAWVGSLVFAAFGLFMGYLLPADNLMQILGLVLALLSFAGGLFMPLGTGWFATVAQYIPTYGLAQLTRAPLMGTGVEWTAVLNVVAWAAVFMAGAAWRFRKDTARM